MSAGFRLLQALWQSSFCVGPPLARQDVQWGAWLVSTTLALRLLSTTPILLHPKSTAIRVPQFKPAWSINNFGFWKLNSTLFISTTVSGLPYILSPPPIYWKPWTFELLSKGDKPGNMALFQFTLISSHFLMSPVQAVLLQDKVASWQQILEQPAFLPNIYFLNRHKGMECNLVCFRWWGTTLAVLAGWGLINYKAVQRVDWAWVNYWGENSMKVTNDEGTEPLKGSQWFANIIEGQWTQTCHSCAP